MTSSRPTSSRRIRSATTRDASKGPLDPVAHEKTSNENDELFHGPIDHAALVDRAKTWSAAGIGTPVTLTKDDYYPFTGILDNKTAEGSVIWVLSRTGIRKLFHIADGFDLTSARSQN